MADTFDFNGHQVRSVREGMSAVISHHVNPVIGQVRLRAELGEPYPAERMDAAFDQAAADIISALQEKAKREHQEWLQKALEQMAALKDEDLNNEPDAW